MDTTGTLKDDRERVEPVDLLLNIASLLRGFWFHPSVERDLLLSRLLRRIFLDACAQMNQPRHRTRHKPEREGAILHGLPSLCVACTTTDMGKYACTAGPRYGYESIGSVRQPSGDPPLGLEEEKSLVVHACLFQRKWTLPPWRKDDL